VRATPWCAFSSGERLWDRREWGAESPSHTDGRWWPTGFDSRTAIRETASSTRLWTAGWCTISSSSPPLEISNQYLPVLGRIAQFAKEPDVPDRLASLAGPDEFFRLLEDKGV
jgi:hypothetical protein